jgi:hypothetical protein
VTAWSGADGNGDTLIDNNDYNIWKTHYGTAGGSGSMVSSDVPEPSYVNAMLFSLLHVAARRKQKPNIG